MRQIVNRTRPGNIAVQVQEDITVNVGFKAVIVLYRLITDAKAFDHRLDEAYKRKNKR